MAGGLIDEGKISSDQVNSYEIFDYRNNDYTKFKITTGSNKYYFKQEKITFPQGSQGIAVFNQKYKIVWRTKDAPKFQYCDKNILLVSNQSLTISSNNQKETLYLMAILNSQINKLILQKNLLQENEQSFFIPITGLKQFVRVPKITEDNQFIKDEIILKTEEMLALEDIKLSDLADFSEVMMQKFDGIEIEDDNLILIKGGKRIKCKIKNDNNLVKKIIKEQFNNKLFKDKEIILSELKSLPAIDFEKQKALKDYIDNLVFVLYFNVRLKEIGFDKAKSIKKECEKSEFYKIIEVDKN